MRSLVLTSFAGVWLLVGFGACSNATQLPIQDAGLGITVKESVFFTVPQGVYVYMSDRTGLCDLLNSGVLLPNLQATNSLVFQMVNLVDAIHTGPVDAGTYQVVQSQTVAQAGLYTLAGVVTTDPVCTAYEFDANGGSVVLASINANDGGYAAGTYALLFGNEQVLGSFDAGFCNYTYVPPADGGYLLLPDGGIPCL
jgi:hypothetical protein